MMQSCTASLKFCEESIITIETSVQLTVSSNPHIPGISSISWKNIGKIPIQSVLMAIEAK